MSEQVLSSRYYLGGLFYHHSGANKTDARKCLLGSSGWTISSLNGGGARGASALAEEYRQLMTVMAEEPVFFRAVALG